MSNPAYSSTPNATSFTVQHGGQYHPAWDASGASYDPRTGRLTGNGAQRIKDAAKQQEVHFLRVMEELKKMPDYKLGKFDVQNGHSWKEVLEVAKDASQAYTDRAKGFKGIFRSVGRKIGDANPALEPFLDALPCGDYSSLVCGGVILIFKAFARMAEVRSKVMSLLGDAPWLLEQVEVFIKLYPNDTKLADRVDLLYTELLRTIISAIQWCGHGIWDRVKVLAQQGLYSSNIDDCAKRLQESAQNLRMQADMCDKEKTVEILELLMDHNRLLLDEQARAMQRQARVEEMHHEQMQQGSDIKDQGSDLKAQLAEIKATLGEKFTTVTTLISTLADQEGGKDVSDSWLADVFKENMKEKRKAERRAESAERHREAAEREKMFLQGRLQAKDEELLRARTPTPGLNEEEVRQLLWDCGEPPDDFIERNVHSNVDQSLVTATAAAHQFHTWFTSKDSRLLLVTSTGAMDASAAAGFSASFATLCQQLPETTTITYFCGAQASAPGQGPVAVMLANLCLQLIASHPYDLTNWSSKLPTIEHHRRLGLKDLEYLESFFQYLLLPRQRGGSRRAGAIFCLIDNFAALEDEADPEAVWAFINYLYGLAVTGKTKPVVLKVLIMRPDRRRGNVLRRMDERDIVRVGEASERELSRPAQRELDFQLERARRMG